MRTPSKTLAEARRLIAAMIRIDGKDLARLTGRTTAAQKKLEGKLRRVERKLDKLQKALNSAAVLARHRHAGGDCRLSARFGTSP